MTNTSKRRGRGGRRAGPAPADAFHLGATAGRTRAAVLSAGQVAQLRDLALALLADHGVVVIHPSARAALLRAGASDGAGPDRLRLPRGLVEEALAATPRKARLCGKTPARDLALPRADGQFAMRTGTGAHGYVAPRDSAYRNTDPVAVAEMAAVAEGLAQVGFVAHPFVHGVAEVAADIHAFAEVVQRTTKHCWMQPYGKENVEYLMRIAAVAAGGEAALKARPLASCITCSFTPLEFKYMDSECIIQAGRFGVPLHACSLPSAGGSAPLTAAGMVLMAAAEIVAMVTLAHVLAPGLPVIATPLMFALDMATGRALQSCPESIRMAAMAIQVMKQGFGLIAHTYGAGSDTPDADGQSMAERALLAQAVALAGADILGGVGQLETATVFSPVQAVLDDELGAMLRRQLAPPEVSAAAMNWDEVLGIRGGGHFLASAQTLALCRAQHRPGVFLRQGRDDYEKSGRRTALDAARERALALIAAAPEEGYLDAGQRREIAAIVAAGESAAIKATSGRMAVI